MIELVNVSKYYTSNGVTNKGLININLKLNRGEIVAITGESGSGPCRSAPHTVRRRTGRTRRGCPPPPGTR